MLTKLDWQVLKTYAYLEYTGIFQDFYVDVSYLKAHMTHSILKEQPENCSYYQLLASLQKLCKLNLLQRRKIKVIRQPPLYDYTFTKTVGKKPAKNLQRTAYKLNEQGKQLIKEITF